MLELIGWFVFGYLMYQLISAWIAMQHIKQIVKGALEEKANSEEAIRTVLVKFEPVKQGEYSVVLVYCVDTGKFLGQASSVTDAREMLEQRYPATNFVVMKDERTNTSIHSVDTKAV